MSDTNSKEHWDKVWRSEGKDTWRIYPKTFDAICKMIGTKKNVLELGCGAGILLKKLLKNGNRVAGIDISEEAVKIINEEYPMLATVEKLPPIPDRFKIYPRGSPYFCDYIVATEFIEHFEDPSEILKEMALCSHAAIIVVPDNVLGHDECDEHYQKFQSDTLKELLLKYWTDVAVKSYIEQFDTGKVGIRLPCLMALCRGAR